MKYFIPIILCFIFFFYSCSHSKKIANKNKYVSLDTVTVLAKKADNIYRSAAPHIWDITHTKVALSFNLLQKECYGKAWIDLHPYFYPTNTLVLDAKSMRIDTVILENGARVLDYVYKGDSLKIRFSKSYQPGDTLRLYIKYTAMPYATPTGGSSAITDDRGLYFINTDHSILNKPVQIWTQGETEANSHWLPTIDKPNERMTTEIELTVPDSFVTLSNGYLARHTALKNGLRTDSWKMDMPIQTYAVMFAIGKFSIIKDHWKNKEVNYYVEPEYAPYAGKMFNNTPEMIEYFSRITGVPFPWNKYDQVVVRDYVSGAMENTTASLFGEFLNQNFREIADRDFEDVVSHELFHQWFGDYVTCESWSNITLNESFANYGEQLWRRYKYGDVSADKLLYDDLQKYINFSNNTDKPLVRYTYDDKEDVFDPISYEKGGVILHYLQGLMGDEAFYKSMNAYLTENALHSAEVSQWRLAIEKVTGLDWNWFFNEFYFHGGHPVLSVDYNYNDTTKKVMVVVKQTQPDSNYLYKLPLKATVLYGDNKELVDWNIHQKSDTFTYDYKNGERPVIIPDAMHWLPGSIKDKKTVSQWYKQFNNSNDYINKRKAIASAYAFYSDSIAKVIFTKGLADPAKEIREYTLSILFYLRDSSNYKELFSSQVLHMAVNDEDHATRSLAFKLAGKWKLAAAKQIMLNAVYDSSYMVAGAALEGLSTIDSDTAYHIAKQLLETHQRGDLISSVWKVIGERANPQDIALFEKEQYYVYGTKKFTFMSGLYAYLENVKNDSALKRGLQIILDITNNEGIKNYRETLGNYLFSLATENKSKANSKNSEDYTTIRGIERIPVYQLYIQKLIDAEKDEEIKKAYKSLNEELNAVNKKTE